MLMTVCVEDSVGGSLGLFLVSWFRRVGELVPQSS